ncbi:MAG: nucleotidyltransferase domain-containing protein [Candidatus Woesearchaeota archaeon]
MKQNELFSYVYDFVSQILDQKVIFDSIRKIILFGSVVRGDFIKKSDIDLFIDIYPVNEASRINILIKKEINKFESKAEKDWHLRGIDLPIRVIVDDIEKEKWKELKEEVSAYGITIFGKFKQSYEGKRHKILVIYDIKKLSQKNKMSFLRKMYGYTLRKESKTYVQKGMIHSINAEKLNPGSLLINFEEWLIIKDILKKYKIKHIIKEIWSG